MSTRSTESQQSIFSTRKTQPSDASDKRNRRQLRTFWLRNESIVPSWRKALNDAGWQKPATVDEATAFSGLAPRNKPDDNPDYKNDENCSHPDSSLEDISDHFAASQGYSRKK
jgi:hypothetical protein